MEQAVAHRGPDEGSIWHDGVCGFAHRRLKIIDLSPLAAQPMSNETGDVRLILNGEIYNFPALRQELEQLGHDFKNKSDTEVLVHGYESWGYDLFRRLRGMFTIAIWDAPKQELIFARDRFGKKPFFYAEHGGRFIFGSELPVFREVPRLSLSISRPSFAEYIEFGYIQSPQTIFTEIRQLPPGHFGVLNRNGLSLQSFWKLPDTPPATRVDVDLAEAARRLDGPLQDAVACRLISDVPLGCFLSGGIDSSLIAAHAQEAIPGRLKTYTVGFTNTSMDETEHAARIARHLGTDHHEITVDAQSVIDEFVDIFSRAPEPIGDDSFLPTFVISRETKREVTVALSGDGGDELFCGYDKYRQFLAASRLRRMVPQAARAAAFSIIGDRGGDGFRKRLEALAAPNDESVARWLSTLWKESELVNLIEPTFRLSLQSDGFACAWNRRTSFQPLERFMMTDIETYLSADILTKVDRASMAHGLEVRNPFLDHEFVGAVLEMPVRVRPGKPLLKEMLARRVPREMFERPKHGFGMPINEWFRGPLRSVLEKYTAPERLERRGLLRFGAVQEFVRAHLSGRRNFGRKLQAIVAFEIWADRFFGDGSAVSAQ